MERSKLVQVMEDLDIFSEPLKKQLKNLGYQTQFSQNRQEFLEKCNWNNLPYAMILDNTVPEHKCGAPESDIGLNLSYAIKLRFPNIKIAIHTSSDRTSDKTSFDRKITSAKERGIVYLQKPVSDEALREFLER